MNLDIDKLESELKKRLSYPYKWGLKQNDQLDSKTNFIYRINTFTELLKKIDESFNSYSNKELLFNYSLNRWFNFWSATAVENIFLHNPKVKPAKLRKDRLKDFFIEDIPFDHKTSVYPSKFESSPLKVKEDPAELIEWFYLNQSQEQRKHFANRLFVVLFSTGGEHWKLKAELHLLKNYIDDYLISFNKDKLIKMKFGDKEILSDLIVIIK